MTPINETNCMNDVLNSNPSLSNALECARTCTGDKPKTCYYEFVVERFPVYGQACKYCTPDSSTYICSNCQCVLADGVNRNILSVNRMMPGPSIQVCLGDFVVVDVVNKVLEEHVTVHWHGLFQQGTQYYDGVPFVTQCPIPSGDTFRYQFHANNSGTHFWHSHVGLQKMNGFAGSFIVREPAEEDPNSDLYDYDLANHVVFISDWMIENAVERFPGRTEGITQQLPDDLLINGRGRYKSEIGTNATTDTPLEVIQVEANKRYRFRMINAFCATCSGELTIQGHNLTVIATDGESVKPVTVSSIVSYAGERYDFVINTDQTPGAYWIQLRGLEQCDEDSIQQLAILQYVNASTTPFTEEPTYDGGLATGIVLNPTTGNCEAAVEDAICVNQLKNAEPTDVTLLEAEPDQRFYLPIAVIHFDQETFFQPNTYNKFLVPIPIHLAAQLMNGIIYDNAPAPMLSQLEDLPKDQLCDADHLPQGCSANCSCTHVIDVQLNATVEIIFVDEFQAPGIEHPIHLHGYAFYVVSMGQPLGSCDNATADITVDYVKQLDANNQIERNLIDPPKKDTIAVPNNGFAIVRFHANNPGFWMLHCHFVYHQASGMEMVMRVGNQSDLPPMPAGFPKCGNFMPEIIDIN
ncbi:uncharacterized protein LOC143221864 [Lasioglossum baleicum]|uniref:uncharacterized protein LOC143221864 n=1 Tax=Lasioglossum baleicum TaxID=434251 RepID=UPI003FCDA146